MDIDEEKESQQQETQHTTRHNTQQGFLSSYIAAECTELVLSAFCEGS
ncbi:MAG: hypothetical protein WA364_07415 [Candidatus Nitrosopolaris sp.]